MPGCGRGFVCGEVAGFALGVVRGLWLRGFGNWPRALPSTGHVAIWAMRERVVSGVVVVDGHCGGADSG